MTQEEKHRIALKRYAAITPLVNGTLDECQSKSSFYREAALKPYPAEDGSMRLYSPAAIRIFLPDFSGGRHSIYKSHLNIHQDNVKLCMVICCDIISIFIVRYLKTFVKLCFTSFQIFFNILSVIQFILHNGNPDHPCHPPI